MCLDVGCGTKEVWTCISGEFTEALLVTVNDSKIAAEMRQRHEVFFPVLNPFMIQYVALLEFPVLRASLFSDFR